MSQDSYDLLPERRAADRPDTATPREREYPVTTWKRYAAMPTIASAAAMAPG